MTYDVGVHETDLCVRDTIRDSFHTQKKIITLRLVCSLLNVHEFESFFLRPSVFESNKFEAEVAKEKYQETRKNYAKRNRVTNEYTT